MLCACIRACFFTHVLWLDILIVIVSTLVQPIPIVDHGYRALFQNGVFRNFLPQPYAYMLNVLWIQLLLFFLASTTAQFIFRYFLLSNDGHIPRSLIWLMGVLAFLLNLFHIILLAWADYPRPNYYEKMEELSELVTQEAGITDVKFSSFTWARSFPWLMHCIIMVFLFSTCYAVITICVFKIRKYVREAFTLSVDIGEKDLSLEKLKMERLRDYNNQLTYALIVQAILPTFEVIAMSTQILLPIFYPSGTTVFIIVYTVIPLYFAPVINPLSTIFLVKPYRRAVINKIFGRNNGEMTHATIKNNTGMPTNKDQQRSFNTVAPIEHGGASN
uniref:Uncharacterized protein n=1 Tax=Meloidogyne incognita TaxID=6306 RepID=A0A914KR59_MELIC